MTLKTKRADMAARAIEHARLVARHSTMKGIPASDAAVALMAQALVLIYGIGLMQATEMVKPLTMLAGGILRAGLIDQLAASEGVTAEQAEVMIADARAKLELGAGSKGA
jgi:hypothetical protein